MGTCLFVFAFPLKLFTPQPTTSSPINPWQKKKTFAKTETANIVYVIYRLTLNSHPNAFRFR